MKGWYRGKRRSISIPKSSIVLNLHPVLRARNITQPYAYLLKLGINTTTVNKMLNGTSVQLNYNQLTVLCKNLDCTPNDLFALREMTLPSYHELNKLPSLVPDETPQSIKEWLHEKSVEEVMEILKNKKKED